MWCTIKNLEPRYQLSVTSARVHVRVNCVDHVQESLLRDPVRRRVGHELARKEWSMRLHLVALSLIDNLCHIPPLLFAASVTVTKAREAKTWVDSALLVHSRSPVGTVRTPVSSRFHMRSCEIPKRSHRQMTRSCKRLRSLAMSASLGLWRVQDAASFHDSCRLCTNCRVHRLPSSNSMSSSRSTRR